MLRTRHREGLLFRACLEVKQPVVIDNTNVTPAERARYIIPAKAAGFAVTGWFFRSRVAEALQRNALRAESQRVPDKAIPGTSGRMILPEIQEGFDALHFVSIHEQNQFITQPWQL